GGGGWTGRGDGPRIRRGWHARRLRGETIPSRDGVDERPFLHAQPGGGEFGAVTELWHRLLILLPTPGISGGGGGRRRPKPGVKVQSLLARGPIGSQPSRLSPRLSRPARERRRRFDRKGSHVRTGIRATSRSCSEAAVPGEGGAAMRDYIGVDWGDGEHGVGVEDEQGQRVSAGMVAHSPVGFSEWGRQLDEWRAQGLGLWAAIERPEGRVVDVLLDHGVRVYPVNPKAVDRARDRFRQSGAKDDLFAARVLAGFLRTDHTHLMVLEPSSEAAQELKLLTEDYRRQVRAQTRLVNQLTATLKAYYPRALEVAELTTALAPAFLQAYPTPATLLTLTERH